MGQKTNPIVLRIGKFSEWDSRYIEKKSLELPKQTFDNISIRSFLTKFLKDNGMKLNKLIVNQSENSIHIFIGYYLSFDSQFFHDIGKKEIKFVPKKEILERRRSKSVSKNKIKFVPKQRKRKNRTEKKVEQLKRGIRKYLNYYRLKNNLEQSKPIKNIKNLFINKLKIRRINDVKLVKAAKVVKSHKNINSIKVNSFINRLFIHLKMFSKNNTNIFITVEQLNKNIKKLIRKKLIKTLKNIVVKLRRYKRSPFYKEGLNVMLSVVRNKNSSILLANFIAEQLKKSKRHNFFLRFIKSGLNLFTNKKISILSGIKIKIKGRLNGRPRARHKIIKIKKGVSVQTFQSKLDYSESTSFTKNGTMGVKVWIEKKLKKR
jgi:ribosomal protein S3